MDLKVCMQIQAQAIAIVAVLGNSNNNNYNNKPSRSAGGKPGQPVQVRVWAVALEVGGRQAGKAGIGME